MVFRKHLSIFKIHITILIWLFYTSCETSNSLYTNTDFRQDLINTSINTDSTQLSLDTSINKSIKDESQERYPDQEISFLFMGDFMQHGPQIKAAKDSNGHYNYDHYFEFTNDLINSVDFAVANLEVTLAGAPYTGYPKFSAPDEYAIAIKKAGFDILTTANNHSNDRGKSGLIRTIKILDSLDIIQLGTYLDSIDRSNRNPLILEKNGIKVALLNYTYGTNGIPTKVPNIVNMIDKDIILNDITSAKNNKVDKIIALTHWGKEYLSFPDKYQKKWGNWMLKNGVDIVIGGHPHAVQPMIYQKDTLDNESLIAWSLGNIISNQRKEHTDGGSSIQFTLYKDSTNRVKIKNIGYHLHWVWINYQKEVKRYQILPISKFDKIRSDTSNHINKIMTKTSLDKLNKFIANERNLYKTHNTNVPEFKYNLDSNFYYLE